MVVWQREGCEHAFLFERGEVQEKAIGARWGRCDKQD